jgi:thioredoxin reductase
MKIDVTLFGKAYTLQQRTYDQWVYSSGTAGEPGSIGLRLDRSTFDTGESDNWQLSLVAFGNRGRFNAGSANLSAIGNGDSATEAAAELESNCGPVLWIWRGSPATQET